MSKRYLSLWFRHLLTDWLALRRPELRDVPFILTATERNRTIITAANAHAERYGISAGMTAADAKAVVPNLQVVEEIPGLAAKLLKAAGEWCIRYTPIVSMDLPEGLMLDISGCTHLWGGEREYFREVITRLRSKGYDVRGAIADTAGAAWGVARFAKKGPIIAPGAHANAVLSLPPEALRLEPDTAELMHKLGFRNNKGILNIKRSALRRRFGQHFLMRLDQALGIEDESLELIHPPEPYHERLPCLEPIKTATAIEIAIKNLLTEICKRLQSEGKGLRTAILKCYRVDGKVQQLQIGTNRPSRQVGHLFKLFELKISTIAPGLGIELFTLEAPKTEELTAEQEAMWTPDGCGLEDTALAELLDKIANRIGADRIKRYLPQERYWPEHAIKPALSLSEQPATNWRTGRRRPSLLLRYPQKIDVMAIEPDNPPSFFTYKGVRHIIKKSDDAERIEPEWWLNDGTHRDYYLVEDENGARYWVYRLGYSEDKAPAQWFLHGYFA